MKRYNSNSQSEEDGGEKEADFHEVNLSLVNPYQNDAIGVNADTPTHLVRTDEHIIDPADRANFARGLTNLPNAKKSRKTMTAEELKAQQPAQEAKPDSFSNSIEYWLTCIGYAVGYGNIWRFPYLLYSNGGGAFLVPYFLSVLFIVIPMYCVETAFGQCYRKPLS